MTRIDPYLLVRAASLYITVVLTGAAWLWRRPHKRTMNGAILAFAWNVPAVLLLHVAALHFGWWRFDASGGILLGMPVDLYLEWAWSWGVIPAMAFPSLSLFLVTVLALAVDVLLMTNARPVLELGSTWLIGEGIGLVVALVPAQLLARWTITDRRLVERALLQVTAFGGVLLFVLPAMIIEGTGSSWRRLFELSPWQLGLWLQIISLPLLFGLTAVQEFVSRGFGTPVPFDPPGRLVTSGVYSYIGNPMQFAAVVVLLIMGVVFRTFWLAAAGIMAHIYSAGLAGWDEEQDLRDRFGEDWLVYHRSVRRWVPRFRPWHRVDQPPALLFVSETCGMCREVARWFERRGARHLAIVPAEAHPSGALRRITYEPGDGTRASSGVEAIARALEHIHLGWALLAFLVRLPLVCEFVQLVADASGAGPRRVATFPSSQRRGGAKRRGGQVGPNISPN